MSPLLLTLFGDAGDSSMFTLIAAIVTAAVTNVVGDVKGVVNGTEDWKTAVLNTFVPYVGDAVGANLWPKGQGVISSVNRSTAATQSETLAAMAVVGISALALVGGTIYYVIKENRS